MASYVCAAMWHGGFPAREGFTAKRAVLRGEQPKSAYIKTNVCATRGPQRGEPQLKVKAQKAKALADGGYRLLSPKGAT